jgi:hypothetical protein
MNCFLIHKWGAWQETDKGDIVRNERFVGIWFQEERRCIKCGKKQIKIGQ